MADLESNSNGYEQLDIPGSDHKALELLSTPNRTRGDLIALVRSIADVKVENSEDYEGERDVFIERWWRDWDGNDTIGNWLTENINHGNFEVILSIAMDEGKDIPYASLFQNIFEEGINLSPEIRERLVKGLIEEGNSFYQIKSFPYLTSKEVSDIQEVDGEYGETNSEQVIARLHFRVFSGDNDYMVTQGITDKNLPMERLELDLQENPDLFRDLPIEMRDIKSIATIAIEGSPHNFQYLSQRLRGDLELTLLAIQGRVNNLEYASPEIKNTPEVALKYLELGGEGHFIGEGLMDDESFLIQAFEISGNILWRASSRLQDDKSIVLNALGRSNRIRLQYVSRRLRNDREVIIAAIESSGGNFEFVSEEFRADREIALMAIKAYKLNFRYISEELKTDEEILSAYEGSE